MRTAIHIALILLLGAAMGIAIRSFRSAPITGTSSGPGPNDIIYTDDGNDTGPIENPEPTHPPEHEEWLSRFELTERSGKLIKSEDLKGQPYIVSFFFSTCPASCIKQNQLLQELQDEFKDVGIRFVSISVDPETDTPEQLREYGARFGADKEKWLFMTGDLNYIRRVGSEIFQQPVDKKFHTDRWVLVDREGKIEGFYNWPEPIQLKKLKKTIREISKS